MISVTSDDLIASRLKFLNFDDDMRKTLREMRPVVIQLLPGILEDLYSHLGKFPNMARYLTSTAAKDDVKGRQIKHWDVILQADFDDTYLKSVQRIGETHNRLGLEPRWYLGGYSFILRRLVDAVEMGFSGGWRSKEQAQARSRMLSAALAAALLDMDFVLTVYLEAGQRDKRDLLDRLAMSSRDTVGKIVDEVAGTAGQLETAAGKLTKAADGAQQRSATVVKASEDASANVATVATATEEMSSSIGEIGRQVQESSRIASEAVVQAQKTDEGITKLSQAASRIGDVTQLITTIAEQTNLLALNATIEAARAGEAGKGFAVVAQEVKQLASQTAKATSEISGQIAEIQAATQASVIAIKEIGGTIARIAEIAKTIAAAVEEQGAATRDIARNVQQAAARTADVATNVTDVSREAALTGSATADVHASARTLTDDSQRLKAELNKLVESIRAA
jgi:methyl-accepting chemotaxis protein